MSIDGRRLRLNGLAGWRELSGLAWLSELGGGGKVAIAMLLAACSSASTTNPPAALEITPTTASLSVGGAQQFSALRAQGSVTWSSSNNAVATVVSTGFATANSPGAVTITATDSRGSNATATLQVRSPAALVLSTGALAFSQEIGSSDPVARTIQVTDGGDDKVGAVSVAGIVVPMGQPTGWVSATLSGASAPAQLTVRVAAGALVAGVYSATISLTATGATNGAQTVVVAFTVTAAPAIQLSTSNLAFNLLRSDRTVAAQRVDITNGGGGTLAPLSAAVSYPQGQPTGWLSGTLASVSAPTTLVVQPTLGALPDGSYSATISIASTGAANSPRVIAVSFVIASQPSIALSVGSLAFNAVRGAAAPAAQAVAVANAGDGTLTSLAIAVSYRQGQPAGWLQATLGSGMAPTAITVRPTIGALPDGSYNATIAVSAANANNSPQTVAVVFTVVSNPSIGLSAQAVSFAATAGGANPPAQAIGIVNAGGGALSGLSVAVAYASGQPAGWLTNATLNQSSAPATLALQSSVGVLVAGTYSATVSVSSPVASNSPATITVTFTVSVAPSLVLGTGALGLSVVRGGATSPTPVSVTRLGGGLLSGLSATVSAAGAGWLTATLTASTTPTTVVITANSATLPGGSYSATVTISSPDATNGPQVITVNFTVLWSFAADVYPLIAGTCTNCHFQGGSPPDLSTATAFYNNLVGAPTTVFLRNGTPYPLASTHPIRIVPGSASTSYVLDQVNKLPGAFPMPTAVNTVVAPSVIARIVEWINQGALRN